MMMMTIDKSAHNEKSLETYRMHFVYIYIYIYIYIYKSFIQGFDMLCPMFIFHRFFYSVSTLLKSIWKIKILLFIKTFLLRILADLNKCLYSHDSSDFQFLQSTSVTQILFKEHQIQLMITLPLCSSSFLALWQDPSIHLSFHYLLFLFSDLLSWQNPINDEFFFLVNYYERFSYQCQLIVSTGVWVTASLLKSSGLFSVFWPILMMFLSGCLFLFSYF